MWRILLLAAITLTLTTTLLAQYPGLKGNIKDRLQQAQDERDQATREAMGDPQPTTPPNANTPPAAQPDVGWLTRPAADGTKVRLYVAHPFLKPGDTPKFPAVVLLHEWWGLNDDIVQRTDEFAGKRYYAVAVDLYDGKVTKDPKEAAQCKDALQDPAALARMKTAVDFLSGLAAKNLVDANHIAAIGWCMGGNQGLKLALADNRISACAVFYGTPITDAAQLKKLQGPVLGIFGEKDQSIPLTQVEAFEKALKDANIKADIQRYPNVGHAFASRAAPPGMYNEEQSKKAWASLWTFLNTWSHPK